VGDTIIISAEIANFGNLDALNVNVRFLDGSGNEIGAQTIDVPKGSSVPVSVEWVCAEKGTHTITAEIPEADLFEERSVTVVDSRRDGRGYEDEGDDGKSKGGVSGFLDTPWIIGVVIIFLAVAVLMSLLVLRRLRGGKSEQQSNLPYNYQYQHLQPYTYSYSYPQTTPISTISPESYQPQPRREDENQSENEYVSASEN
jgi:hypothetical protein